MSNTFRITITTTTVVDVHESAYDGPETTVESAVDDEEYARSEMGTEDYMTHVLYSEAAKTDVVITAEVVR